jgi:hypothetical protein
MLVRKVSRAGGAESLLFQRAVDARKFGVQVCTKAVDDSDDRKRNTRCNQAIFDGSGAGLIFQETRKKFGHVKTPC